MDATEYVRSAVLSESSVPDILAITKRTTRLLHAAMGAATEAGELVDALKKHLFYRRSLDFTNIIEEAGDLLWYVAILCDALDVSMELVMERNIEKLRVRYPEKFDALRAQMRDLAAERAALEAEQPVRNAAGDAVYTALYGASGTELSHGAR